MLTQEKWKKLSLPFYTEELELWDKAADNGLTDEERARLAYLTELLERFFKRFLKHYPSGKS